MKKNIKAVIIDDERLARKELSALLSSYNEIEVIAEASHKEEALEKINDLNPDLLFLDIEMPGGGGFELLEILEKVPKVIFTTAYDEYALKAFDVNALDYLLKPIDPARLQESIKKLRETIVSKEANDELAGKDKLSANDQVFVKDGDRCWFVKLSEVRLFESDGNYVKVYFNDNRPMIHKSLNALNDRLDDRSFFRSSRKHIINLQWIEKIEPWFNGGLMVTLKGGEQVEVSRRQASKFKEKMSL